MTTLNPYLSFRDRAREAMSFYQAVFGGDLTIDEFGSIDGMADAAEAHLVLHASLTTPDGFTLMASDTPAHMTYTAPSGMAISVSGDDETSIRRFWDGLSEGGSVTQPLGSPPWGGLFGMLTDRFGVDWLLAVNAPA
ncbi:VOC family protein [Microbacterium xanthum]|uniref:VOC family protein n=1 Tax=Microbacterium xanthum TaxID=3079794 RepID=UPI002AD29592|nr:MULTISPECIES: VOC family protein [unclassified Microbacterium]MDZ8171700.1 VOC family protein [Microbacterium sp. KSW-48]MDZ8200197.1 VOC family protein [Microbacterium sp. SSW1-59]